MSKTTEHQSGFSDEELDALLPFLVHEGYLKKQTLANGKVWYKRTRKKLPTKICIECGTDNFMHKINCSKADLSTL